MTQEQMEQLMSRTIYRPYNEFSEPEESSRWGERLFYTFLGAALFMILRGLVAVI